MTTDFEAIERLCEDLRRQIDAVRLEMYSKNARIHTLERQAEAARTRLRHLRDTRRSAILLAWWFGVLAGAGVTSAAVLFGWL